MKRKKKLSKSKKYFNLTIGTIIFILLIGSAFSVSWIFGLSFFLGFIFSIYKKTIDRRPFFPLFLFIGGLIVRTAFILFLPGILESKNYLDLIISSIIFLIILIIGLRIKKR